MMKYFLSKNKGISLIEVTLSLAVIAIVLVLATRYYGLAHSEQQINDASSLIQAVRSAGQHWLLSHDDFTDISVPNLMARNLLPPKSNVNPWGGTLTVASAGASNNQIKITMSNIPVAACQNLQLRFNTSNGVPPPNSCIAGPNGLANYIGIF